MCSNCEWEDALSDCDELLGNPDYEFAEDTLSGIQDWIEENRHVTPRQADAIENIRNSKS